MQFARTYSRNPFERRKLQVLNLKLCDNVSILSIVFNATYILAEKNSCIVSNSTDHACTYNCLTIASFPVSSLPLLPRAVYAEVDLSNWFCLSFCHKKNLVYLSNRECARIMVFAPFERKKSPILAIPTTCMGL